jgi:hypothetical protein
MVSTLPHLRGKPRSQNQNSGLDASVQYGGALREDRRRYRRAFPESNRGNQYLLVAMDYFTKFPEVYAILNQEASTVADALVNNYFCRFGVTRELYSDQGRNFEF